MRFSRRVSRLLLEHILPGSSDIFPNGKLASPHRSTIQRTEAKKMALLLFASPAKPLLLKAGWGGACRMMRRSGSMVVVVAIKDGH